MFLEVKNISKSYADRAAISDISFQLEKGKLLCLLGPSGCGKSTILNALGGFIQLDEGAILLDGQDISHLAPEDRDVATVFQSYGLFPHMTVLENIQYGLKFKGYKRFQAREMAMAMVEKMNLRGNEDKRVTDLSGGQQQRVALGRSLIIKPQLLLLDEPLSNLDAKLRINLREEIRRIQKEFGVTMVFVTHDQQEAFEIADEIILLDQGEIVQIGTGPQLYLEPCSDFVLDFIGMSNRDNDRYLRPEQVKLKPIGASDHFDPNRTGQIEKIVFQGSTSRVLIRLNSGELIEALQLTNDIPYQKGDPVYLSFEWKHLMNKEDS